MSNNEYNLLCTFEEKLGDKWIAHWNRVWPHCKRWYLSEGLLRRAGYQSCIAAIEKYMPELIPIYNTLTKLSGGHDIESRFLSLYNPPPYLVGCSQVIWDKDDLFLIKNYDYGVSLFERTLFSSCWLKPVMGLLDCAWGLLDGINGSGLVASLTFGGRKEVGDGFGAPLIVRYLLETCDTVAEAKLKVIKLPCHMSYNITLLDKTGAYTKIFLFPNSQPVFKDDPISTNHQERIVWEEYAKLSKTLERYDYLNHLLKAPLISQQELVNSFFKKPLFSEDFENHFATLYTSMYFPIELKLRLLWRNNIVEQSFDNFIESETYIKLDGTKEF